MTELPEAQHIVQNPDFGGLSRFSGLSGRSSWGASCRFARIVELDDVPIGLRPAMRREAEHRFERDVAMKAAVLAKDEFIEVDVDVFASQAVILAQRPALHQRESAMAPWQDDTGGHGADDTRIMPTISGQSGIGGAAIGDHRRARLHVGRTKASIDLAELSAITARRSRPERVSRYFAPLRLGLGLPELRSITSTVPATRLLPARKGISV